jgi:glucan phosphorylase
LREAPCENKLICIVPGYKTGTCNNLRLWGSKAASGEFDFQKFNSGEYESSVADQQRAETISAVLYPNDKCVGSDILRDNANTS